MQRSLVNDANGILLFLGIKVSGFLMIVPIDAKVSTSKLR
jgi:hypothetical protein